MHVIKSWLRLLVFLFRAFFCCCCFGKVLYMLLVKLFKLYFWSYESQEVQNCILVTFNLSSSSEKILFFQQCYMYIYKSITMPSLLLFIKKYI